MRFFYEIRLNTNINFDLINRLQILRKQFFKIIFHKGIKNRTVDKVPIRMQGNYRFSLSRDWLSGYLGSWWIIMLSYSVDSMWNLHSTYYAFVSKFSPIFRQKVDVHRHWKFYLNRNKQMPIFCHIFKIQIPRQNQYKNNPQIQNKQKLSHSALC